MKMYKSIIIEEFIEINVKSPKLLTDFDEIHIIKILKNAFGIDDLFLFI